MYIANVVGCEKPNGFNFPYEQHIRFSPTMEDINVEIPTLLVGWGEVKKMSLGQEVSILEKTIIPGKWMWTFSQAEKGETFFKDLHSFLECAPSLYFATLDCTSLDPIFNGIEAQSLLSHFLNNGYQIYSLESPKLKTLFLNIGKKGINLDLNLLDFLGWDTVKLVEDLSAKSALYRFDSSNNLYRRALNLFPNYNNVSKYLGFINRELFQN